MDRKKIENEGKKIGRERKKIGRDRIERQREKSGREKREKSDDTKCTSWIKLESSVVRSYRRPRT